jgi:hypothetical protein
MKLLLLVPSVLAMQVSEEHGTSMNMKNDIESMKELFLGISKSKIDGVTRDAVFKMMTDITNTLETAVASDMQFQKDTLDCKVSEIEACSAERARNKEEYEIDNLAAQASSHQQDHRACRIEQQDCCDGISRERDSCDRQAFAINRCRRPTDDFCESGGTSSVLAWMQCIHDQMPAARALCATHVAYESNCNCRIEKEGECAAMQRNFEIGTCAWQTRVDEMCYNFDRCYDDAVYVYRTHVDLAVEAWNLATTQMEALTSLKCYGQSILDNRTDLGHCDDLPCENCPPNPCEAHCPPPAPHEPCRERERMTVGEHGFEMLPRPCEQTFLDEEYNSRNMGEGTCTPAAECITCHDFHAQPMYLVGRGQCLCPDGRWKDELEDAPQFGNAMQCTQWCHQTWGCNAASWNADTHECVGLQTFDTCTQDETSAWSCFSRFSRDEGRR